MLSKDELETLKKALYRVPHTRSEARGALLLEIQKLLSRIKPLVEFPTGQQDEFFDMKAKFDGFASRGSYIDFALFEVTNRLSSLLSAYSPVVNPVPQTKFPWVSDVSLRTILDRDLEEAESSLKAGNHKACTVLCGSVLEAALYAVLRENPSWTMSRPTHIPKQRGPKGSAPPRDISSSDYDHQWTLDDLIKFACNHGVLDIGREGSLSDVLREPRNLIHPTVEIRGKHQIGEVQAKASLAVMHLLLQDLSRRNRPWLP